MSNITIYNTKCTFSKQQTVTQLIQHTRLSTYASKSTLSIAVVPSDMLDWKSLKFIEDTDEIELFKELSKEVSRG